MIQLLELPWEARAAEVDESSVHHPDPAVDVVQTAQLKAVAVARQAAHDAVVVAFDTTVVLDQERLNKPLDDSDAFRMLSQLRGRLHQVHTGIVVVNRAADQTITDVASVDVPMRAYSDAEIAAYVATGDPLDKAGAYAIQNMDFRPVTGLTGCYAAVVGLPLCHLTRSLRQVGVKVEVDIAGACQAFHDYQCPIFDQILNPG